MFDSRPTPKMMKSFTTDYVCGVCLALRAMIETQKQFNEIIINEIE